MSVCLQSYFGLSQTVCACPDFAGKPADTSGSGFWIDDDLNLQDFVYNDCGQGSIWDVLTRAKQRSIQEFKIDFAGELGKVYSQRTQPFSGFIATAAYTGFLTSAKEFNGARLDFRGTNGSSLKIDKVVIGNNLGGASVLKIWKGYSTNNVDVQNLELIYTQNITLLLNAWTIIDLTTPLEVDLKANEHYFVSYNLPVGSFPFNNIYPECGGCHGLDTRYKDTLTVRSFTSDNETTFSTDSNCCGYSSAYGIRINATIQCNIGKWFCDVEPLGQMSEHYMSTAKALTLKAQIIAIQHLLDSNQINFTTLTSRESLYGKREHFKAQYQKRIEYLSSVFPVQTYNCMTCGTNSISTKAILT